MKIGTTIGISIDSLYTRIKLAEVQSTFEYQNFITEVILNNSTSQDLYIVRVGFEIY